MYNETYDNFLVHIVFFTATRLLQSPLALPLAVGKRPHMTSQAYGKTTSHIHRSSLRSSGKMSDQSCTSTHSPPGVTKMHGHTFISVRKTPTRTTLLISLPAASRMALRFLQHTAVFSAMLPSTKAPFVSAGICPDTQTCPAALMAWL